MGPWALLILLAIALVLGFACELVGRRHESYEWEIGTLGAIVGGFAASCIFGPSLQWGPEIDGIYPVPALIGGLIVAIPLDAIFRRFGSPISPTSEYRLHA